MAWETIRWCGKILLGCGLGLVLPPASTMAQGGNGIKGDYYDGPEFERFVVSRRDASLSFDWGHRPPAPGLPAEYFSVRWTGWLVPPATGRYVFHVTVDDGIRIWLNDQLIMDEWRPQWITNFTIAINLKAGEPYRLRVDYFQDILDTRAVVTWERPDTQPPTASWRNLWGMNAETPTPKPIPTQFLYTQNPKPTPPMVVPLRQVSVTANEPPKSSPPRRKAIVAAVPVAKAPPPAKRQPAPPLQRPAAKAAPVPAPEPSLVVADSGSSAQLARLAVGEAVTLPELYFNQGQHLLLPAARTALDGLAQVLSTQPALHFEVQGHTDNVGNAELNRQLSQRRAETVCLYLAAHGVKAEQLRPVGFGGSQPVADNADPAQRPRNRRVVLRRL